MALKIRVLWRRINYSRIPEKESKSKLVYDKLIIDARIRKVFIDGESRELTYKEFDTLYFLAKNYAQVFSREKILNEVWGFDYMGNSRAVDILIKRLRSKISPCETYISTVYGIGYKFEVSKI